MQYKIDFLKFTSLHNLSKKVLGIKIYVTTTKSKPLSANMNAVYVVLPGNRYLRVPFGASEKTSWFDIT